MSKSGGAVRHRIGARVGRLLAALDGRARSREALGAQKGARDERSTGPGGYAQGRVRPDVGREARALGGRGPHFAGWEIYHLKGSPSDPNRLYASQSSSWFGQLIQRSNDGGKSWEPVGNEFAYDGVPGTHQWYDGTPHPWEFARVWHLEPSLHRSGHGLRRRRRRRPVPLERRRADLAGAPRTARLLGLAVAAGRRRDVPAHDPARSRPIPARIFIAISSAGAFRSDDAGKTWRPINRGLRSEQIPNPTAEVGHCVHRIAMHPSRPNVLFMQKHWDVMRSDDAGESWREVSGNLPSDFGFPIEVHAHEPDTIYVVPIKSDSEHYPPDGKLRVYRSRTGGNEWEALTKGLPQSDCYVNVLRDAMAVDSLDPCGVYFGTSGGQVYASAERRRPLGADRPRSSARALRRGADAAMIRVVLPEHLRTLARITGEVQLEVREPGDAALACSTRSRRAIPMLRGTIRDHVTQQRRAFVRFFACEQDLSNELPDAPLPDAVARGAEPFRDPRRHGRRLGARRRRAS